ncbi:hypothetical protein HDU86_005740 [Geranomyces michiganensis]|nr:hypothetical protein HDU86_005740 [Geranomyces michiganensis]
MQSRTTGSGVLLLQADIHALPFEVLSQIASYLATYQVVRRLSNVSRRFAKVSRDTTTLELDASESVLSFGLQRITDSYPRLQRLVLTPDRNLPRGRAALLLKQVAAQFEGHPAIREIHCATDLIVPGAINGCPALQSLRVEPALSEFVQDADMDDDPEDADLQQTCKSNWASSGLRRNLAWILHIRPDLKRIQLDDAHLWLRASQREQVQPQVALRSLSLTSMAASSLLSFVELLQGAQQTAGDGREAALFPNLVDLEMEIDYAFMPAAIFPALSTGCPNLISLALSTLEAPPSLLPTMAKAFVSLPLRKLVFDKCSLWFVNGWAALVDYITCALPSLTVLEFERCLYRELPPGRCITPPPANTVAPFPLTRLKLYLIGDFALSATDVRHFVDRFTSLKDLRLDVPADTCANSGMDIWALAAADKLKSLERLSLKSGSVRGMNSMPYESDIMPRFEALTYLALTSCPVFPTNLLRCNADTLVTLKLNYLPAILPAGSSHIAFASLKRLVVRGISTLGHKICLAATAALTFGAPRLECLTMEAFSSASGSLDLPDHFLPDLVAACPNVRSLRLSGFRMPRDALRLLSSSSLSSSRADNDNDDMAISSAQTPWPHLATFHVWGAASLPVATRAWEDSQLGPFLTTHRGLTSLHLGLAGIDSGGLVLPRAAPAPASAASAADIDDSYSLLLGEMNWEKKQMNARAVYNAYARRLLKRYVWLDDVLVSGPVAM